MNDVTWNGGGSSESGSTVITMFTAESEAGPPRVLSTPGAGFTQIMTDSTKADDTVDVQPTVPQGWHQTAQPGTVIDLELKPPPEPQLNPFDPKAKRTKRTDQ